MAGIFKSYDIRGLCPGELDEPLAQRLGAATAECLGAKKLALGWDMRPTSPGLRDAFTRGANSRGCSILDLGMVTTPLTYWAVREYHTDGSVMITASHNPAEYNGMKICRKGPEALSYDTGLKDLEARVKAALAGSPLRAEANTRVDPWPAYTRHLKAHAAAWRPLKIVVDAGNGMGGYGFDKVFGDLPHVTRLFFEPDGTFPNHESNPLKEEGIRDLKKKVLEVKADLGVAFDGDADRCAFIDEKGEAVPCDLVTALFAGQALRKNPGSAVLYDLRSSHCVPEVVKELGGRPIRDRVGHSHMKKTLRESGAVFGGELSGHYYFRDHANSDSGLMAFVWMMNVLGGGTQSLSELVKPLRRYAQTGEINFEVEDKDAAIARCERHFKDGKQDHLDGLTVEMGDWWFNLRKSNTEPLLRLNLEARTATLRDQKLADVKKLLEA
ncbi:MAG: phosphomannomutase/phosphoglucomutase [Planctomycetota bacterium]